MRALVGDLPIAVTHDYHANVPPELVDAADSLIIYKTNPHIDQRERGLQAASILTRQIRGEVRAQDGAGQTGSALQHLLPQHECRTHAAADAGGD